MDRYSAPPEGGVQRPLRKSGKGTFPGTGVRVPVASDVPRVRLGHGDVVIAASTSCDYHFQPGRDDRAVALSQNMPWSMGFSCLAVKTSLALTWQGGR